MILFINNHLQIGPTSIKNIILFFKITIKFNFDYVESDHKHKLIR